MRVESLQDLHLVFPDIDGFWENRDLGQTENKIRALLPSPQESFNAQQVETLIQLGRLHGLQGQMKESLQVLEDCEQRLLSLSAQDRIRPEIRWHLEMGRYFSLSKFPSRAIEAFKNAWLAAEKALQPLFLIETAYMFSITLPQKQSREWLLRALEIIQSTQDPNAKKWFPLLSMTEAWHHFDAHRFEKALEVFRSALSQCEGQENRSLQKVLRWCEARTLRALKQPEEALKIQEDILTSFDQMGLVNGFVYLEIAECWQDLDQKSKSQPFYAKAAETLEKNIWYADNHGHELSRIQKNAKNK